MEIKIIKDEFVQALTQAQGIVEKKNVMPVLANVLLEASGNVLKISATDLEVALHVSVQAQVFREGRITVSAKKLFDIVRESAGSEVQLKAQDNERLDIASLNTQCRIMALAANEFPKLPEQEGEFVTVKTDGFLQALEKVSFAMSADETRYHLNGIYIEKSDAETIFVATDGHRLSLTKQPITLPDFGQAGIIIPRKGVNELKKLVSAEKAFQLSIGKRHIFAKTEQKTIFIRLIDGDFPNYSRVIPQEVKINATVPRLALVGALRRVSLLSDEYSKGVKLTFARDQLLVSTINAEMGEAKEEIALAQAVEPIEVSFNARYLLDVLGALSDESVVLGFNEKAQPSVVKSPSDASFTSVIMPIRV